MKRGNARRADADGITKGKKGVVRVWSSKGTSKILERTGKMYDSFPASQNQSAVLSTSS